MGPVKTAAVVVAILVVSAWAAPASAQRRLDYNEFPAGTILDNEFIYEGVEHKVWRKSSGPVVLTLYNTNGSGGADTDLEAPFLRGNLPTGPGGNILIIPENATDANDDGLIDRPNDEAHRPSGDMRFEFSTPITSFGFDLIDVEGPEEYNNNGGFFASFYRDGDLERRIGFGEFVDPTSPFYDPTVQFGDKSANRIQPITAQRLGLPQFDLVVLSFGGSGGTDNIIFAVIPEPSGLALLGLAVPALLIRRRSKR